MIELWKFNIFLEFEVGVSLWFSFVLCGLMVYKLVMVISGRRVLSFGSRIQIIVFFLLVCFKRIKYHPNKTRAECIGSL